MRAVKARPWRPVGPPHPDLRAAYPPRRTAARTDADARAGAWPLFGAALLLGYLPGILAARSGGDALLAAYYMDKQNFSAFVPAFADLFSAALLQATLVLLCGFCCLGLGLLLAFFALRGAFLGYCAASVFAAGGAKGLVAHWLLTCLPDLGVLLVLVALAARAAPMAGALLRTAISRSGAPGGLYQPTQALVLHYLLAALEVAAVCALGAWSAVFFAGILL